MNTQLLYRHLLGLIVISVFSACGGGGGGGGSTPQSSGILQIEEIAYDAAEGTVVNIRVVRSGGNSGTATVAYATSDGTATAGSDYGPLNGTLNWPDGVSGNRTISISIADDDAAEASETFDVTLSNVSGATLGVNSSTTVNIVDNDAAAVAAFGTIADTDGVTVNGIRYNTSASSVYFNGTPGSAADLRPGQVVTVRGEVNFSDATGRADEIRYAATAIGPIEIVDATLGRLVVMGQTVLTSAETAFGPGIDADTLAGLSSGSTVQVSGHHNADGDIIASRIEHDATSIDVQLIGEVTGLDLANMLFRLNRLTIDYSNAVSIDLPTGMPSDGLLVVVRGALTSGVLRVREIAGAIWVATTPGERVHLGGIVTRFASSTDFDLNGVRAMTRADTRFTNGVIGDLQANAEIFIDGESSATGISVLADRVSFGRPLIERLTESFDFTDFTRVSVHGITRVTVSQGPDFSVDVAAAADVADSLPVSQSGETITFGDMGARMLVATVTMPVLERIDLADGSIANVTIKGFDQPNMSVHVNGVSYLRGEGLVIGDLTATVSGVSSLDFSAIRPIANADIDISGVSQATLNMAVGSSLAGSVRTGQGTGVSTLFYYGNTVTLGVTTDSVSRVIRLGDTRL